MKKVVKIMQVKLDGSIGQLLGSDGEQIIDGRLGLDSAIVENYKRFAKMRNFKGDSIVGAGLWFDNRVMYKYYMLEGGKVQL